MNFKPSLLAAALGLALSGAALAAVSPQEAAQLGGSLTLVGAEKGAPTPARSRCW